MQYIHRHNICMKKTYLKLLLVIVTFLMSIYFSLPNFDSKQTSMPKVNLGLDIRGGLSILLEADFSTHAIEQLHAIQKSIPLPSKIIDGVIVFDGTDSSDTIKVSMNKVMSEQFYSIYTENGKTFCKITHAYFASLEQNMIDRIIDVIRYRIDATGMQEISIQKQGSNAVLVQIPGATNRSDIKKILSQTGSLKFHLVDMSVTSNDIQNDDLPLGVKILPLIQDDNEIKVPIFVQPLMYGEMIADAQTSTYMGKHIVNFKLTDAGTRKFAEITKNNVGKVLAIVLDNKVITAPHINEPILTGSGQISGNFTFESAKQLAILLRSGSLPVPVKIIQENLVGPTLGKEAVQSGANAVIIGCILVILIMIGMYRGLGLIASIGLICNLTLMFAILSIIEATITLPGIAGLALTLGMAVDANVLIYERMREESKTQKSVLQILRKGYDMALRTILDSNITTVIVALLLYAFGSSSIKGFAITLIIGIISSMITAVIFTKILIDVWYDVFQPRKFKL